MSMEKTFDAASAEAEIFAKWEAIDAFKAGANANPELDKTFSIMIPPPNVTGVLHMGHAFNNTLQDILVRWHRMRGFDTLWQPGQDHAGIATQMVVERKLAEAGNEGRKEMGREKFLEKVWEWKEESGGQIVNQLKRLGASCDWSRNRFTMDPGFHEAVLKVFVEMYNKGLIYKGNRLVNWDPKFETAISDLEVENIEVDGHMWHFKYPLADGETYTYVEKDEDDNVILTEERDYIAIATTRPETMLGDGAVAVHPSDGRYASIVGKMVHLPLCDRLIPIITDEYPDPNFGSGAVKITGAHDFNDYAVAKRNNIPMYPLMDVSGHMVEGSIVPEKYRGMERFLARKAIVADIDALGLMTHVEDKKIMQPFGDRSKVVIEPMLTDQWFVDTKQIVQPAIDAVRSGETKILPEQDSKVYFHWLENIEPWCISRQLWWGHQIPVWYDMENNAYCASSEEEAIADVTAHYAKRYPDLRIEVAVGNAGSMSFRDEAGRDIPFVSNVEAGWVSADNEKNPSTLFVEIFRDPDVLDTWFSSGLWPIGTLGWPENTEELQKYFPTDVLITGFDIIFFWVARMMMMQLAVVDQVPFRTVYVHALVRDEKGKKMSKSTGNVLDPLELIDQYGTDAVRFTLTAMAAMGRDLKLSTQRIEGYRNFGTKLWNAARFAEMNECIPSANFDPSKVKQTVNQWIVGETARALEGFNTALDAYRFNDAANGLYAFVRGLVCDWYIEFAKPLFQSDDAAVVAETRATMAWAIDQSLILLHPIMPYMTEQLWGDIAPREKMLVHADWPEYSSADLVIPAADTEMRWVIGLIESIRSVRSEMRVPAGAKIPMVQLELDEAGTAALQSNAVLIQKLARIAEITVASVGPKGAITIAVAGGTFCLPLADIIDIDAENARLSKAIEKLGKEIGGIKGKLSNEKFTAKAPAAVIEENRQRLSAAEAEVEKLQAAMQRLADLG
ncbi:MAG: valine--tRNA ligase [Paracoccaceae bacterium]